MSRPTMPRAPVWVALIAAATVSCALVMDVDFDGYHGGVPMVEDAGGAGGAGGMGGAAGSGEPDAMCEPRLVLNEIQTVGPGGADDEFVEVFNAGDCPADLTGVQLVYRSSSATVDHGVTWSADAGVVLAPGAFYVVGGATFAGTPTSQLPAGFALGATGGGLAIRVNGDIVDKAAWGDATNEFVNQLAAVAPVSGSSIARHPDGWDTNSDMADLTEGAPSPGAPNGAL